MRIANLARRIAKDCRGATAIEYGLILALIFLAMLAGFQSLGNESDGLWGKVENKSVAAMQR